ncbi:MAG: hypothetical protein ACI399_02270 [Candidatus Cryptobacteroides sp.]
MDISLFSEMVKNLILDNDEVTLPGVGSFVSEIVPSSFSDKGYTINPPYRKLSFRHRLGDDRVLAEFYAKANGTDYEYAETIIKGFLEELQEELQTRKTVELPGLGRLRATKEGTVFFIPDEDLDIYCSGFGLQPVSLKTHEETPEEVSKAVADLKKIVETGSGPGSALDSVSVSEPTSEPAIDPISEPTTEPSSEPSTEPAEQPATAPTSAPTAEPVEGDNGDAEPSPARRGKRFPRLAAVVIFILLLAFGGFILASRIAPGLLDKLLYSQDELNIIEQFEQRR